MTNDDRIALLERTIREEIVQGERRDQPIRRGLRSLRVWMSRHPFLEKTYRVAVGVLGGGLSIIGLLLVPLPGPGWLVVFLGLAILGTEFHWAKRVAAWLKRTLDRFWTWFTARRAQRRAQAEWERAANAHARQAETP
ncbi:TIGR02611 family protein [Microbacterium sp. DT81.1]|uniref:TIGR02611 family protein n=1 Tax=Microbacterium sp. DT81.1 TaxID=3393413 RepID=UPI003CE89B3C